LAKSTNNNPQFSLCCENGKVLLPNLPATPQELEVLLTSKKSSAVKFQDHIRMYNSVLAFTLLGAKVDESVTRGLGPYSFCIQGEFYHKIGSLGPVEGLRPQFAQLYIHDTKREHQNHHAVMPSLDPTTLDRLLTMMYNINPYVEVFKMARDMMAIEGDALPSPGVNPLEGSPKCSYGKLGLGRRSRVPTLERGRGSSWEPRD
jgi:hypothetical protein